MDAFTVDYADFSHDVMLHDLGALSSSLLESTVNIAKFSKKVHEIAQHTKNPKRLLKLWGEIEIIIDAKNKTRSKAIKAEFDLPQDRATAADLGLLIKLRELKHETHRIFAADNAKRGLKNKLYILAPIFGLDVIFSDFLTYALPVLRPVFFTFGMHLAYKANKESHEKAAHDDLAYGEIIAKHDKSHKWAMVEISSVLTIYTAGLPRDQQAIVLGAFSAAMIAGDLTMMAIPRLELLGDHLAVNGRNPATRLAGRSMQRSGEFLIEKAFPRAAYVAEYILAGRAITHSSLYIEQELDEVLKYVRENCGEALGYIVNMGSTGLVGFAMSHVATAMHKKALVPINERLAKTELWRFASAASNTVFTNTSSAKRKMQTGTRSIVKHTQELPDRFRKAMVLTKRTMQTGSQRIIDDTRNLSHALLVRAMVLRSPKNVSRPRPGPYLLSNRPAYYAHLASFSVNSQA